MADTDEGKRIRAREREELRREATTIQNSVRELDGEVMPPAVSAGLNICNVIAALTIATCNVGEELANFKH